MKELLEKEVIKSNKRMEKLKVIKKDQFCRRGFGFIGTEAAGILNDIRNGLGRNYIGDNKSDST